MLKHALELLGCFAAFLLLMFLAFDYPTAKQAIFFRMKRASPEMRRLAMHITRATGEPWAVVYAGDEAAELVPVRELKDGDQVLYRHNSVFYREKKEG